MATWIIGGWLYMIFCCKCENEKCYAGNHDPKPDKNLTESIKSNTNGFLLSNENFTYHSSENFKFLKNNFNSILPISDSINLGIDNLKKYLDSNNQNLKITGYALISEKNTSIYENLGLARAADVKKYFVSKGISADRMETFGEIKNGIAISGDTIIDPASYTFFVPQSTTNKAKIDYTDLKAKINANPLIMYFKTGEASINLTENDRKKVVDILTYLENVSEAKISITGHSDNVGKREINLKLGLERAQFAQNYLIENAIPKNKIEITSKGPDEPIADNTTIEGRNKNRRTVISIK